jgi:hypothetical protein
MTRLALIALLALAILMPPRQAAAQDAIGGAIVGGVVGGILGGAVGGRGGAAVGAARRQLCRGLASLLRRRAAPAAALLQPGSRSPALHTLADLRSP